MQETQWSTRITALLTVYVLVSVFPSLASANANSCRALLSDEAAAVHHMRTNDISHMERIPGMFEILPKGTHALNTFAAKIKAVYGGVLVYFPRALREGGGRAYATSFLQNDGSRVPAIFMAKETLFGKGRPLRDLINLHELRHLRFQLDLRARKPSPFYGDMTAKQGLIPDKLVPDSQGYREKMSFEELKTFSTQLQQMLTLLRGAIRGGDAKKAQELLDDTFDIASTLALIAHRSMLVLEKLEAELAAEPAGLKFENHEGFVIGVMTGLKFGEENVIEVALPLVAAKTATDANLRELFDVQKNLLKQATIERLRLFDHLRAGQMMLSDPRNPTAYKVMVIDELQKTLGALSD